MLCLIPYDGDDEAVAIANDSDYGLHGGVFSGDPERGLRVARRLRTGQVHLNGFKFDIDVLRRVSAIGLRTMLRPSGLR